MCVCLLRATDFKVKMCELREHDGVSGGAVVGGEGGGGRGGGQVKPPAANHLSHFGSVGMKRDRDKEINGEASTTFRRIPAGRLIVLIDFVGDYDWLL